MKTTIMYSIMVRNTHSPGYLAVGKPVEETFDTLSEGVARYLKLKHSKSYVLEDGTRRWPELDIYVCNPGASPEDTEFILHAEIDRQWRTFPQGTIFWKNIRPTDKVMESEGGKAWIVVREGRRFTADWGSQEYKEVFDFFMKRIKQQQGDSDEKNCRDEQ